MSDVKKPPWQELKDLEEDLEERARLAEIEEYRKRAMQQWFEDGRDRKSTRLNSSHT